MKQNKGAKPKKMSGGRNTEVPDAGNGAVQFRGTYVHAEPMSGVTRPAKGNAGSHDHVAQEHADHKI